MVGETVKGGFETLKSNLNRRASNIKGTINKEVDVAKGSFNELKNLRPLKAVQDLANGTARNIVSQEQRFFEANDELFEGILSKVRR